MWSGIYQLCAEDILWLINFLKPWCWKAIQIYPFSRKQPQGMTIAVNVMLTIESNKGNYIIDLSSTLSHSFLLILSVLYGQLYLWTYYFEFNEIKKHSRH